MNEFQLKYGCNPNQKPSRIYMENGEELPDKIQIQLLKTDPTIPIMERFVKNSEKHGLYNAMDIASIWLERALKE